ncbi:MAG TPA: HPF/RaiA family ribosome-associated protein [Thermoanaerobaculia bacterium]|jgi:cold shock CspA family protein/ribosome-associated translation inhibitor RaiA|nr:HPF/RaiA family ribosome-associated protein [Thermoanaerobaculia bacterium]
MDVPILQVSFRGIPPARQAEIEERVRRRAEKLEKYCDHLMSCRVAIERPHKTESNGNPYRARIDLMVPPGHELVVRKEPGDNDMHADLVTVINGAFDAAERVLAELAERQRGAVKFHRQPLALVVRLFRDQSYGFLKTPDGRDVYFHQNAVPDDWDRLELGTQVRFEEAMGDLGPQATTVQIVDKPGSTLAHGADRAVAEPLGWEEQQR